LIRFWTRVKHAQFDAFASALADKRFVTGL